MQLGILPWWLNKSILSKTDCKNATRVSAHICYLIRRIDRSASNKSDGLVGLSGSEYVLDNADHRDGTQIARSVEQ